jgi:undecaprenyl-diphosphatase
VAAALLALFAGSAWIASTGLLPGDQLLTRTLAGHEDRLVRSINRLVSAPVWSLLILAVVAGLWRWAGRGPALLLLAASLSAEAATLVSKLLVDRQPPGRAEPDDWTDVAMFPSGHAVRATVTLGLLIATVAWQHPRWRWPASLASVVFLLAVGAARVAAGAHWPSDVLGGYLLGAAWVCLSLGLSWRPRAAACAVRPGEAAEAG